MKKTIIAVCALLGAVGAAHAAGDAAAGKAKSVMCAGCHGPDGNSTNPMYPRLAGQHEQYLISAIKAYKEGTRNHPVMKPMAAGLSDQDIENLAAYFSSQKCK
ncbi:MAG: cytochrome c [Gammaproteobacteria bacterium]|nr:MAG: cytochrome c [Gammaproteobacteria bacterium]